MLSLLILYFKIEFIFHVSQISQFGMLAKRIKFYSVQKGEKKECKNDGQGVWGREMQTVTFGVDGQWGSTTAQGTLCDLVTLLYNRT